MFWNELLPSDKSQWQFFFPLHQMSVKILIIWSCSLLNKQVVLRFYLSQTFESFPFVSPQNMPNFDASSEMLLVSTIPQGSNQPTDSYQQIIAMDHMQKSFIKWSNMYEKCNLSGFHDFTSSFKINKLFNKQIRDKYCI